MEFSPYPLSRHFAEPEALGYFAGHNPQSIAQHAPTPTPQIVHSIPTTNSRVPAIGVEAQLDAELSHSAVSLETSMLIFQGTVYVDGVPVPPHQLYYPRTAWGPPPPRKVVLERLAAERRKKHASDDASIGVMSTVNPSALVPKKRKDMSSGPDPWSINGEAESTNPTAGDLDLLSDGYTGETKPPYSYATILKFAILGSPRKKLSLAEIYETIVARFPFYRTLKSDWQVSLREASMFFSVTQKIGFFLHFTCLTHVPSSRFRTLSATRCLFTIASYALPALLRVRGRGLGGRTILRREMVFAVNGHQRNSLRNLRLVNDDGRLRVNLWLLR